MKEIVRDIFTSELGIESGTFTEELRYNAIPEWDSASHMVIVMAIEERFNVQLESEEIVKMTSIRKIYEVLQSKGIVLNEGIRAFGAEFSIHRASDSDTLELGRMRDAFWKDQIVKGLLDMPALDQVSLREATSAILKRSRTSVFLCRSGGAPIGYILGQTKIVPAAKMSVISSIEELYIEPQYRRTDAGRDLMNSVMRDFNSAGAERIQLRVLSNNTEGRKFWERHGFVVNVLTYEYEGDKGDKRF